MASKPDSAVPEYAGVRQSALYVPVDRIPGSDRGPECQRLLILRCEFLRTRYERWEPAREQPVRASATVVHQWRWLHGKPRLRRLWGADRLRPWRRGR